MGHHNNCTMTPTSGQPLESGIPVYSWAFNKLADITCREKAGSIFDIFWALRVQMEMLAINKHPLIETIVYTETIFCKVTEAWHNTCQTPAIEDKLDFTWISISFLANQEERKLYTRKTQPPQTTATKCVKLQNRIGPFTDSTKRAAILVVNGIVEDISNPLPLPNAVGRTNQPTNQQLHNNSDIRTAAGVRNTCIQLSLQ